MKRTLWYPGNIKPVHVGAYERITIDKHRGYSWWNGSFWGLICGSTFNANLNCDFLSKYQTLPWRGLEEKSE
jgi:hypothetical protein